MIGLPCCEEIVTIR